MQVLEEWHALGNSYLLVERADRGRPLDSELAGRLCDVRYGIGSDGVLEVVAADGVEAEVVIWNPDGSVAEFSGNGSRIAAAWLAVRGGAERVTIAAGGRTYSARVRDDGTIAMAVGDVEVGEIETVEVDGERRVDSGLGRQPARGGARASDSSRAAPARAADRDERALPGAHERPVGARRRPARGDRARLGARSGGDTASGSSAVAVASAAIANGWCESPVTVHMPGGELRVELDEENMLTLVGPAEKICEGELTKHDKEAR